MYADDNLIHVAIVYVYRVINTPNYAAILQQDLGTLSP